MNVELRGKLAGVELGPKMQACNERERVFAFLIGSGLAATHADAAREAGFGGRGTQAAYQQLQRSVLLRRLKRLPGCNFAIWWGV
jgi:hypothetical protein